MVVGLERYHREGHLHFVTLTCHDRLSYLGAPFARNIFEDALQRTHRRYRFDVIGYVVMPEHVHLLLSEPPRRKLLAAGLRSLKLSMVTRTMRWPFWQRQYHDSNVFTAIKRIEKLDYIHANPVKRLLVASPEDWQWSSCRHYQTGHQGRVEIASSWRDQWKSA
jgi:putative transposase